mmetsp:Transcript_168907/g.542984  ORF Transcript_168907/g.542984 Transcript_168907/m.542984 type:complete len:231 (-) Transcript_168907:703-1395(-)
MTHEQVAALRGQTDQGRAVPMACQALLPVAVRHGQQILPMLRLATAHVPKTCIVQQQLLAYLLALLDLLVLLLPLLLSVDRGMLTTIIIVDAATGAAKPLSSRLPCKVFHSKMTTSSATLEECRGFSHSSARSSLKIVAPFCGFRSKGFHELWQHCMAVDDQEVQQFKLADTSTFCHSIVPIFNAPELCKNIPDMLPIVVDWLRRSYSLVQVSFVFQVHKHVAKHVLDVD